MKRKPRCTVDSVPVPGETGLDRRAECPVCGRRVAVTRRGRFAAHSDAHPMKRKPAVCWVLLSERGGLIASSSVDSHFGHVAPGERVVKLVEADPLEAARKKLELAVLKWAGKPGRARLATLADERLIQAAWRFSDRLEKRRSKR